MTLRHATEADATDIARTLGDWCRETDWMPKLHTRDEDLGFARHLVATHVVWLGRAGGGLGFLARQGGEISALYLDATARGHGLGKALLDQAKMTGPLGLWTFQANLGARRFYAREGFREMRLTDGSGNDEKLPDIRLEWSA